MAHDLVVRGATIVDGHGTPGFEADVAVDSERIVAVGDVAAAGIDEIDGRDLVLAPGWIDTHTHLDANQFWDPFLTPCSRYGVTTVVISNCGYALAPTTTPEQREYVTSALVTVEQVPRDAIDEAVPFDWTDHASYVDALDRVETALNRAFLVGHLPVRAAVMGPDAARTRVATPDEIREMCELVADGLRLGALGFSTDQVVGNIGPGNTALPGQVCDDEELLAIARVLGEGPGPGLFTMAPRALLLDREQRRSRPRMARTAGVGERQTGRDRSGLRHLRRARRGARSARRDGRGASARQSGRGPGIAPAVRTVDTSRCARRLGARAPDARRRREGGRRRRGAPPRRRPGRHGPPARGRRSHPAELGLQRALGPCARSLHTAERRSPRPRHRDDRSRARRRSRRHSRRDRDRRRLRDPVRDRDAQPRRRAPGRAVAHPAAQLGGSDAGAHTQSNTDSCYAVWTLQHWVREQGVLPLETAVAMLTGRQAELFGIRDRGRIEQGAYADLVLFDPARIGIDEVHYVSDMPAGGTRLVAEPVGITASIVNGKIVTRDGALTGARPGVLLRGT